MDEICRHYGIENIRLHDIDKQWGHPSVQGMQSIDVSVLGSLSPDIEASVSFACQELRTDSLGVILFYPSNVITALPVSFFPQLWKEKNTAVERK